MEEKQNRSRRSHAHTHTFSEGANRGLSDNKRKERTRARRGGMWKTNNAQEKRRNEAAALAGKTGRKRQEAAERRASARDDRRMRNRSARGGMGDVFARARRTGWHGNSAQVTQPPSTHHNKAFLRRAAHFCAARSVASDSIPQIANAHAASGLTLRNRKVGSMRGG